MAKGCRLFGAKINVGEESIEVEGSPISHFEDVIQAGNSGIVLRFCSALGALSCHPVVVTGDDSIRYLRPMEPLLQGLEQLGATVASMRGDRRAPVIIQGPLRGGKAVVNGEDSQVVSALLIAGAFAKEPIAIEVQNPGEKPFVSLTLDWLSRLGIDFKQKDFTHFQLFGNAVYPGFDYCVSGDFSSAAFPLAAALITDSEITLTGIDKNDVQGDKVLIDIFQKMGGNIVFDEHITVKKGGRLKGISIDINDCIDALPILAVVGCFAEGETHIYNGKVARTKECNRIKAIVTELRKMGGDLEETEDGVKVRYSPLVGTQVFSYHDHRMAMSLAIAGMAAQGQTTVESVECIAKTFPSFQSTFQALRVDL